MTLTEPVIDKRTIGKPLAQTGQTRAPNGKFGRMPAPIGSYTIDSKGKVEIERYRMMYASFPYFMSELNDDKAEKLIVSDHHEEWGEMMESEKRLCILAPRDHGKTWTALCFLMWKCWKHNRKPDGKLKEDQPDGEFQAVLANANHWVGRTFWPAVSPISAMS